MPWGRLDDSAYTHPKFLGLDPAAVGLWAMALSYCNHHLTDGCIPRPQLSRLIAASQSKAEARSRAGRIGGRRSAEARRTKRASKPEANHEANASGVLEAKRSPLHSTNPPIVPPSPFATSTTTNGDDPNATPRGWIPPPGTIYPDGCAKPGFAHIFPPERRGQCPKHQVGQQTASGEAGG